METEKRKAYRREYEKKLEVQEKVRKYRSKVEVKERMAKYQEEYAKRPEVIAKRERYLKEYYEQSHVKERIKKRQSQPEVREKGNLRKREVVLAIRRWVDEKKTRMGCVDCGYNSNPAALEFDHLADKKLCVSQITSSIRAAVLESAKCVVRCSNCHR